MSSIEIITINLNNECSTLVVPYNNDGRIAIYDSDIADALSTGEVLPLKISGMTECDLGDGDKYGKVYVNISEDDPRFEEINDLVQGAGSLLHETDPELQDYYDGEDE